MVVVSDLGFQTATVTCTYQDAVRPSDEFVLFMVSKYYSELRKFHDCTLYKSHAEIGCSFLHTSQIRYMTLADFVLTDNYSGWSRGYVLKGNKQTFHKKCGNHHKWAIYTSQ